MKPHQLNNLLAVFAVGLAVGFPSGCGNEAGKTDPATLSHDHGTAVAAAPAEQAEPADQHDPFARAGEGRLNEFQPPDKIMDAIGLKAGMVIGEIGAGWGRFTVHLAKRVGDAGRVYANDIDKGVLSLLDQRIKAAGLANVEIIVGEVHDPLFPPGSLDMAFMINVYNAFEDPVRFLRNIAPALKPGGTLAIVLDDPAKSGGESAKSATREQFLSVVDTAGYRVEKEETFLVRDGLYVLSVKPARSPVIGTRGLVSAAHPLAAEAGIAVLKKGGNAFDAAIAVAAMLNVAEPNMSGMGGYGTILVYNAGSKEILFLNSSGRIPAAVDSDVFREPTPGFEESRRGPKAVSTPGNVHAWEAMSGRFGRLKWAGLFEAAIRTAESGFAIDDRLAGNIRGAFPVFSEYARGIYGIQGTPLPAGAKLIQKDLGRSLRAVAEGGAKAFYEGEIGRAIDAEMKRMGGFLAQRDLAEDQAEWFAPISIKYRGYDVYTASPPATSFCSLIRLGMMSRFDPAALKLNAADTLHRFIEVSKHAFWCRLKYAGDPGVEAPPLDRLLSESYWKEQADRIDPNKAAPFVYPGMEKGEKRDGRGGREGSAGMDAQHTTHFVVADAEGNLVSATQTLGNAFGSRIMAPGTGIWLNNSLAYCTFEPKGNPMDAHAGRRKLSGDCPTIIMKGGAPWAALGTPGGHTIGQTVPQMVMNLIDSKLDIAAAIAAPRVSFIEPDIIQVEEAVGGAVIDRLRALGHNVRVSKRPDGIGNAHGLTVEVASDGKPARFAGAADPRGRGAAVAY